MQFDKDIQESAMKYFTPSLLLQFQSETEDVWVKAHDLWEQAIDEYTAWMDNEAPELVRAFARYVGSLHDFPLEVITANQFRFSLPKKGQDIVLTIVCERMEKRQVYPEAKRWDDSYFAYDEFQVDDGILSYHFYTSNGIERSFYGITEMNVQTKLSYV